MARIFNGTSHYLRVAPAVRNALPITLSAWVKPDRSATGLFCAVSQSDEATANSYSSNSVYGLDGTVFARCRMGSGTNFDATTTDVAPTNTWVHIAAVFVSDISRTVYLNGGSKVTTTTDAGTFTANYDSLTIGALRRTTVADYFKGKIHSASVWGSALTDAQIAQLALGADPTVVDSANLLGNWSDLGRTLVGSVGGTLVDIIGSTTTDNDTPFGVAERRPVYVLPSITGLKKWIDYIPVAVPTTYDALDINTFNTDGVKRTVGLSSVTGLTAWVDYTPVYVVTATAGKQWKTDEDGWIPVTHV